MFHIYEAIEASLTIIGAVIQCKYEPLIRRFPSAPKTPFLVTVGPPLSASANKLATQVATRCRRAVVNVLDVRRIWCEGRIDTYRIEGVKEKFNVPDVSLAPKTTSLRGAMKRRRAEADAPPAAPTVVHAPAPDHELPNIPVEDASVVHWLEKIMEDHGYGNDIEDFRELDKMERHRPAENGAEVESDCDPDDVDIPAPPKVAWSNFLRDLNLVELGHSI
jgi:hypothetical protein